MEKLYTLIFSYLSISVSWSVYCRVVVLLVGQSVELSITGFKEYKMQVQVREAIKKKIRSNLGHCPNREGGWLRIKLIFQTVYEIAIFIWDIFGHLKFYLICVPTSLGRGGWQATWDNVPSLTRFFF